MENEEEYLKIIDKAVKDISERFDFDSMARDRLKGWFDNAVQNERYKKYESKNYYEALSWFYTHTANNLTSEDIYEIIHETWGKEIADRIKKEME